MQVKKISPEEIEKSHNRLSEQQGDAFMAGVDGESDAILWDTKSDVNPKEAEIFQAEAKSRRNDGLNPREDENFIDSEANSVVTSNLQNCGENKRVELVTEEKNQATVSVSSTMATYGKTPPEHKLFINFRGDGLRHGFVCDLVKALKRD